MLGSGQCLLGLLQMIEVGTFPARVRIFGVHFPWVREVITLIVLSGFRLLWWCPRNNFLVTLIASKCVLAASITRTIVLVIV